MQDICEKGGCTRKEQASRLNFRCYSSKLETNNTLNKLSVEEPLQDNKEQKCGNTRWNQR